MVKAEKVVKRPRGRPPTKHLLDDPTTISTPVINHVDRSQQQGTKKKKKKNKHKNQYSSQTNNDQVSNKSHPKIYKNSNKQQKSLFLSNKAALLGKYGKSEMPLSSTSSFPHQLPSSSSHSFPKSPLSQNVADSMPFRTTTPPMPPLSSSFQSSSVYLNSQSSVSCHRHPQQQQPYEHLKKQYSLNNNVSHQGTLPSSSSSTATTNSAGGKATTREVRHTAYPVDRILSLLMMNDPMSLAALVQQLSDELPKEIIQSTLEILQILGIVIRVKALNLNPPVSTTSTTSSSTTSTSSATSAAAIAAANNVVTKESSLLFTMNHHAKSSEIVDIADMVGVTAAKRQNAANIRSRIQLLQELSMQQDISVADRRIQFKQLLESLIQKDHTGTETQQSQSLQQQQSVIAAAGHSSPLTQAPPLAEDRLYREILKQLNSV